MRLSLRHLSGAAILGSLLLFQNCAEMPSEEDATKASYMEGMPFAYKPTLDTIAYMSCSRMKSTYEPRAFFTIRAGAYTPMAGLEITQEFATATQYQPPQGKRSALSDSLLNANTRLQLALRNSNDLQSVVINGAAKNGTSLGSMMTNLSASPIVEHLVTMQPGLKKHYFPSGAADRLMASSLRFNDGDEQNVVDAIRKMLRDRTALLALTFTDTDSANDQAARGPAGISKTEALGMGYQLQFGVPAGKATAEPRVLSSITEVQLRPGYPGTGSQWSCPASMQLKIVQNQDLASAAGCALSVDYYSNETERLALDAIRRVLPVEDFFVDVKARCAVAKSHIASSATNNNHSCYGDRTGRGAVDYNSNACSGDSCPHYVSVCIRTQ